MAPLPMLISSDKRINAKGRSLKHFHTYASSDRQSQQRLPLKDTHSKSTLLRHFFARGSAQPSSSPSTLAIAVATGCAALLVCSAIAMFFFLRFRRKKKAALLEERNEAMVEKLQTINTKENPQLYNAQENTRQNPCRNDCNYSSTQGINNTYTSGRSSTSLSTDSEEVRKELQQETNAAPGCRPPNSQIFPDHAPSVLPHTSDERHAAFSQHYETNGDLTQRSQPFLEQPYAADISMQSSVNLANCASQSSCTPAGLSPHMAELTPGSTSHAATTWDAPCNGRMNGTPHNSREELEPTSTPHMKYAGSDEGCPLTPILNLDTELMANPNGVHTGIGFQEELDYEIERNMWLSSALTLDGRRSQDQERPSLESRKNDVNRTTTAGIKELIEDQQTFSNGESIKATSPAAPSMAPISEASSYVHAKSQLPSRTFKAIPNCSNAADHRPLSSEFSWSGSSKSSLARIALQGMGMSSSKESNTLPTLTHQPSDSDHEGESSTALTRNSTDDSLTNLSNTWGTSMTPATSATSFNPEDDVCVGKANIVSAPAVPPVPPAHYAQLPSKWQGSSSAAPEETSCFELPRTAPTPPASDSKSKNMSTKIQDKSGENSPALFESAKTTPIVEAQSPALSTYEGNRTPKQSNKGFFTSPYHHNLFPDQKATLEDTSSQSPSPVIAQLTMKSQSRPSIAENVCSRLLNTTPREGKVRNTPPSAPSFSGSVGHPPDMFSKGATPTSSCHMHDSPSDSSGIPAAEQWAITTSMDTSNDRLFEPHSSRHQTVQNGGLQHTQEPCGQPPKYFENIPASTPFKSSSVKESVSTSATNKPAMTIGTHTSTTTHSPNQYGSKLDRNIMEDSPAVQHTSFTMSTGPTTSKQDEESHMHPSLRGPKDDADDLCARSIPSSIYGDGVDEINVPGGESLKHSSLRKSINFNEQKDRFNRISRRASVASSGCFSDASDTLDEAFEDAAEPWQLESCKPQHAQASSCQGKRLVNSNNAQVFPDESKCNQNAAMLKHTSGSQEQLQKSSHEPKLPFLPISGERDTKPPQLPQVPEGVGLGFYNAESPPEHSRLGSKKPSGLALQRSVSSSQEFLGPLTPPLTPADPLTNHQSMLNTGPSGDSSFMLSSQPAPPSAMKRTSMRHGMPSGSSRTSLIVSDDATIPEEQDTFLPESSSKTSLTPSMPSASKLRPLSLVSSSSSILKDPPVPSPSRPFAGYALQSPRSSTSLNGAIGGESSPCHKRERSTNNGQIPRSRHRSGHHPGGGVLPTVSQMDRSSFVSTARSPSQKFPSGGVLCSSPSPSWTPTGTPRPTTRSRAASVTTPKLDEKRCNLSSPTAETFNERLVPS